MTPSLTAKASYRAAFTTGSVTVINAATATAGHMFAARWRNTNLAWLVRSIEAEFILTTAFGAAQEVGIDIVRASITSSHTGGTTLNGPTVPVGAKKYETNGNASAWDVGGDLRIATTADLTAGSTPAPVLDTRPVARSSFYAGAVGAGFYQKFDFSRGSIPGLIFQIDQGLIIRNSILMGATGVGRWTFTFDCEEVQLG